VTVHQAFALLEFGSVSAGLFTVDAMLKRSPVAVLRCGSVHPGRYLALVGGSVASTEEAHGAGIEAGFRQGSLLDDVLLADPDPGLAAAVMGERSAPQGDAVGVCEVSTSPSLLRVLDRVLKSMPIHLVEVRLADDLGGRALAVFDGHLPDVQEALGTIAHDLHDPDRPGDVGRLVASSTMPRIDDTLRDVLAEGTRFRACSHWTPDDAEILETEG
jgi:microcompartment protein CcmL/EutN